MPHRSCFCCREICPTSPRASGWFCSRQHLSVVVRRSAKLSGIRLNPTGSVSLFARLHAARVVLVVAHMTAPRPVFPGQFLVIQRRCVQRQFLLRPDDETNNAFTYLLAEAAQRFNIDIVLSQMMSNHHHTAIYDPDGRHVEFRAHFHKLMAKSQNALRGRWENMWSTEEPCVLEVVEAEDLLNQLVYIATNPVKDGLVDRVHHWPGPRFVESLFSGCSMKVRRPRHFFRDEGPMPEELQLRVGLPDHFEGKEGFLDELRRRITQVEQELERARQLSGRRVIGRRAILQQSWLDTPTSHEPRRNLRPRVAARDRLARLATLQRNEEWQAEYRSSRLMWLAGFDVEFPQGTYWLRRFARVRVKPLACN
jgi:putative transposase